MYEIHKTEYFFCIDSSNTMMENDGGGADICRVCRSEGVPDRPLFHPCICTGSIKWIHQECLVQWMRYSRKEYCELCGHRFSFTPIYSPDMPRRLPLRDLVGGLFSSGECVLFNSEENKENLCVFV